ncbi:MOSC domain-containing protein [Nocardioides lentus]|uniref:MOSC domain-containing protein n=1 Tax=Nocardioides lentus TaxID=338077 RepID=A0ABN2PFE9_9ACTN
MPLTVSALHRYPVKSCGGTALDEAVVEPWGLAGDRRWLVTDVDGGFVTARELPLLLTVGVASADDGALTLTAAGRDPQPVAVPAPGDTGGTTRVGIWRDEVEAVAAPPGASAWLSAVVGHDVRLLHLADPAQRPVSRQFAEDGDRVSFADGYPLLVTTEASLTALNHLVADGRNDAEWPVDMGRFRPNLVVAGGEAWDEDGWRRIRVGAGDDAATFRAVKGCARCVMTVHDPATGERGKEPLATLARHRRWDGQSWFGMNLVPDTPGATVRVGDQVEVLERADAGDGPPRGGNA